jgi:hypothetical protein
MGGKEMYLGTRIYNSLVRKVCTLLIPTCLIACSPDPAPVSPPTEPAPPPQSAAVEHPNSLTGKELVDIHCVRCHVAPVPADLSKERWPRSLAAMGLYLGFEGDVLPDFVSAEPGEGYAPYTVQRTLLDAQDNEITTTVFKSFVLSEPLISEADWLAIRDYFVDNAPLMSEMFLPPPEHPLLEGFIPTIPTLDIEPNGLVITTLVDEDRKRLYVGRSSASLGEPMDGFDNGLTDDLLAFDLETGTRVGYKELDFYPVDLELTQTGIRVSVHGQFPVEAGNPKGYITDWTGFDTRESRGRMVVSGIHRITEHHTHDLNGDGLEDIVATMFGDGNLGVGGGRFSVYWQTPEFAELWEDAPAEIPFGPLEGALRETVLLERAGMIGSTIADFNNDGKPDIALLTAQAHQELILFINQGNSTFTQTIINKYSPAFGGNSVYAEDMDGDGYTDIVLINGDWSTGGFEDGLSQPKAYHGLRIYRNNGDLTFTERYYYPMHGALKSAITDYDGDGDQDIALIAEYPRWEWEEPHTFAYLENQGGFEFAPAVLPREYFGVWISVETADVNADDKPDIVLGLGNWPLFVPSDWTTREIVEQHNGEVPTITFLLNDH